MRTLRTNRETTPDGFHNGVLNRLATHIASVRITDFSLAQRAGTYAGVLERIFLKASKQQDLSPSRAWRTIRATYETTISDPGSRDAQLLYVPEGTSLQLKNKPARLTARAIRRPEPDIELLVRASLEYYRQVQQERDGSEFAHRGV